MQKTPPPVQTIAPSSMMKFLDKLSGITYAVNPAALFLLPYVYTPICEKPFLQT